MKKNLFMVAAVALFAAVSCNKEFEQMNPQDDVLVDNIVSFEASIDESNTKTTLEGTKTMWIDEEWIQIVGTKSYWFNSEKLENPSEKAIFSYNGGNGAYVEEGSIMAVYPAGSKNYTFDADNKTIKNVEIPVSQTATLNNYDKNAALMVAYANATDATLQFKNATALLKFAVTNDNVKSFTFFGHNEEPISGNVSITVTENTDVPLTIQGFKPDSDKLYLVPNSNWKADNARFAAYFFGNGDRWVSMTDADGDGIYEVAKQSGFPSVIFCRMNPSLTANNWDNKWNQTTDLTIPTNGNNLYTVKDGTWDEGTWSMFKNSYVELAAKEGFLASGQSYYAAIAPCVFEKGFAVELEIDGKKHQVKSYDKPYTINRNTIIDLGTLTYIQKQERNLAYEHSSISVILGNSFTNTLAGSTDGVQYSSSDPTVATVDENGTVTVVKEGTTIITAVAPETETYYAGEASYTLTVTKKTDRGLKFSSDKASLINDKGTSSTLSGITDGVTYLSYDNSVATVDATTGAVTMVSPGVVKITATAPETEEYEAGEASYTLSLNMLYLKPNSNWKVDNARFAAYFFGNGEKWVDMKSANANGIYEVAVPTDKQYPNVIFCRMNPSASANNWNNKWNQTDDLTIPANGNNLYTVKDGTWDKGGGTWSVK